MRTAILALQPEVERAEEFAVRLAERVRPSGEVRRVAERSVARELDLQKRNRQVDTEFTWKW